MGSASYHLPGPSHSVSRVRGGSAISGVLCVSSGELISGATLLVDVSRPGSQEDLVSNWETAHRLMEDAMSGAEIAPCLLALAVVCLPLCLWQGERPVHSWLALLWYSLNPLFCERAQQCPRLELVPGKFSLSLILFSLSLAIPHFGLLSHWLPQIILRAFKLGPYPKQCSRRLPVQPLLAGSRRERLGYFTGSCS